MTKKKFIGRNGRKKVLNRFPISFSFIPFSLSSILHSSIKYKTWDVLTAIIHFTRMET